MLRLKRNYENKGLGFFEKSYSNAPECLSDNGGKLKMDLMDGFKLTFLNSDDVFLVNSGEHVYCWIGIGASVEERKNGMTYANDYVSATETPWLPISVLAEGKESVEFFQCFQG